MAQARPEELWYLACPERLECHWAERLLALPGAAIPVPRFGASDCRCPAHLVYWPDPPMPEVVGRCLMA